MAKVKEALEQMKVEEIRSDAEIKPAKKTSSAGSRIRKHFRSLIRAGAITEELLKNLQDKDFSRQALGSIKYPFLKAIHSVEKEEIRKAALVNGHPRYSTKPVEINGASFLITNDLYAKNVKPFNAWVKSVRPAKA
jgi:hypothetical protein